METGDFSYDPGSELAPCDLQVYSFGSARSSFPTIWGRCQMCSTSGERDCNVIGRENQRTERVTVELNRAANKCKLPLLVALLSPNWEITQIKPTEVNSRDRNRTILSESLDSTVSWLYNYMVVKFTSTGFLSFATKRNQIHQSGSKAKSTVSSAQHPGRVQIEGRAEKRVLRLSPARLPELAKDGGVQSLTRMPLGNHAVRGNNGTMVCHWHSPDRTSDRRRWRTPERHMWMAATLSSPNSNHTSWENAKGALES